MNARCYGLIHLKRGDHPLFFISMDNYDLIFQYIFIRNSENRRKRNVFKRKMESMDSNHSVQCRDKRAYEGNP